MYFSDHMQWYCEEFLSSSTSGPPLEQSSCSVVDLIPKTNSAFSGTTPMLHRETNHAISQTINAVRLMKAPWSHFRQPLTVTSHPCLPVTHTHANFVTGQMPFLPPNQQCQSTEGDACLPVVLKWNMNCRQTLCTVSNGHITTSVTGVSFAMCTALRKQLALNTQFCI